MWRLPEPTAVFHHFLSKFAALCGRPALRDGTATAEVGRKGVAVAHQPV